MIGDNKQNQTTSDNAISNQANGNISQEVTFITNNGCTPADVTEICMILFDNNFSKLESIAQEKARREVESYSEMLYDSLINEVDSRIEDKLKEPEVQAAINDTVKIVARKGNRSNKELLSQIIKDKISKFDDEEESGIIDDAIEAMGKLSKSQLVLFSITHAIRTLSITQNGKSFTEYEKEGFPIDAIPPFVKRDDVDLSSRREKFSAYMKNQYLFNFEHGQVYQALDMDGIQAVNIELLQSRGLLATGKNYTINTTQLISAQWGGEKNENLDELMPKLSSIMKKLGFNGLSDIDKIILSPISSYIGNSYLSSRIKIIKVQ